MAYQLLMYTVCLTYLAHKMAQDLWIRIKTFQDPVVLREYVLTTTDIFVYRTELWELS